MRSPDITGSVEIELYADGSSNDELGLGAWAFKVPKLNLEGVGSSEGKTTARFELLAVLNGIEAVVAAEQSGSAIHVFTDCESTVSAINRLGAGLELRKPEKYADRADLLPRLEALLLQRSVRVTRVGVGPIEHQDCHRRALSRLRQELAKDTRMQHRLALRRQRSRMAQLLVERGGLVNRLEKIEEEITLVAVEIDALESSLLHSALGEETTTAEAVPEGALQPGPALECAVLGGGTPPGEGGPARLARWDA
jgi:ribonuclease HI